MRKFERTLQQYTALSEQLAVWKQLQTYLSHFMVRDTEPEPRQTMTVQIPTLGSRQISQLILERVDADINARIQDLLEQVTSLE